MKTEEIKIMPPIPSIDWDKSQLVKHMTTGGIVLTSGTHSSGLFTGTVLTSRPSGYDVGKHVTSFEKSCYIKVALPIAIKFED